jgi:hypothetical protein
LKDQPRLIDDFFGREAVRTFLGAEAADALGDRLDAAGVIEFRVALGALYREVFGRLERGVQGDDRNIALSERFVLPDVLSGTETGAAVPTPRLRDRTRTKRCRGSGRLVEPFRTSPRVCGTRGSCRQRRGPCRTSTARG